jgi:hypothetical protein
MICIATQMIFLLMIISSSRKDISGKQMDQEVTLIDDDASAQLNKLLLKS